VDGVTGNGPVATFVVVVPEFEVAGTGDPTVDE
jgi:hypothetical protein